MSTAKFGRVYKLSVQVGDAEFVNVELPFTIDFDIERHTLSSASTAKIRVYNLGAEKRNAIRFNLSNVTIYRQVRLYAGYNDNPPLIFQGNISQAWSYREGVNFITHIECYDGGFALSNGFASMQFPSGTTNRNVAAALVSQMPHTNAGAIGSIPGSLSRGASYTGNVGQLLTELTNGALSIGDEKIYLLGTSEYINDGSPIFQVTSETGLLGTPMLEQNIVRFDMIFEPGLKPNYLAHLDSSTGANFNGNYKVTAVSHKGTISAAVCGEVVTTGEFFFNKIFEAVQPAIT